MERLAKLFLSFVDLAEVEVQSLKRGIVRLGFTIVFLIGGAIAALVGVCMLFASAFIALENLIGRTGSYAVVGGLFLVVGVVLLTGSWKRGNEVAPAIAAAPEAAVGKTSVTEGAADDSSLRIAS